MASRTPTGIIRAENWAEQSPPRHPHFEDDARLRDGIARIKAELTRNLIVGARLLFFGQSGKIYRFDDAEVRHCWELALKAQKYKVIYPLSRNDARNELAFARKHGAEIAEISVALQQSDASNRLFNYAIHAYVVAQERRHLIASKFLPPNAFASLGPDYLAVREVDFFSTLPQDRLKASPDALFDLHDFAHQACATLAPHLYRNKYFDQLALLPNPLTSLITKDGYRNLETPEFSDSLVFRALLLGIYDRLSPTLSADETVAAMAEQLVPYFLAEVSLPNPFAAGVHHKAPCAISPGQLATLVENKFYELPASEIEQRLFVRGGDNERDPLAKMSIVERIEFVAALAPGWLYFERRNTLRHRAHLEAYRRVAVVLLGRCPTAAGRRLLQLIIDRIEYKSYRVGEEPASLWTVLRDVADPSVGQVA